MKTIAAIIFDFDGVILDSAKIKTEAFLELFKDYPQHQKVIKEYHIEHQGITRYKKFEWIYKELLNKDYNEHVKKELGNEFSRLVFNKVMNTNFIAGAKELLESIQNRVPAFIASGTPDDELNKIIKGRNVAKYFQSVYGSNISKEEAIDRIIQKHSLQPARILFVGDAVTDWNAAKAKGLPFIAVYSEEMEGFWESNTVQVVQNLKQLEKIFELKNVQ